MNKKLLLICAFAFLCFTLPRVSAQGETEFETGLTEGEVGNTEGETTIPNNEEAAVGGNDGETGESEVIIPSEEGQVGEGATEEEEEEEGQQEEEEEDTETVVVVSPSGGSGSITTATMFSAPALVGSTAVLAVSALLMF